MNDRNNTNDCTRVYVAAQDTLPETTQQELCQGATLLGILGIRDPLRAEVWRAHAQATVVASVVMSPLGCPAAPTFALSHTHVMTTTQARGAVLECANAQIVVRMVTGDALATAQVKLATTLALISRFCAASMNILPSMGRI